MTAHRAYSVRVVMVIFSHRAEMEKAYGHALIKMAESSARQKTESSGELKQGWETLLQGRLG